MPKSIENSQLSPAVKTALLTERLRDLANWEIKDGTLHLKHGLAQAWKREFGYDKNSGTISLLKKKLLKEDPAHFAGAVTSARRTTPEARQALVKAIEVGDVDGTTAADAEAARAAMGEFAAEMTKGELTHMISYTMAQMAKREAQEELEEENEQEAAAAMQAMEEALASLAAGPVAGPAPKD